MSCRRPDDATDARSRLARRLIWALVFGVVALAHFTPTLPVHPQVLDDGFHAALAYMLDEGLQAGVDFQWTYGPLGHFISPRYIGGSHWPDYAVKLTLALLAAFPLTHFVMHHPRRWLGGIFLLCTLGWIQVGSPENGYLAAAAVQCYAIASGREERPAVLAVLGAVFAFLALGKFTLFVLFSGFLAYTSLALLARGQRARAVVAPLSFALVGIAIWIAAGQHIAHLPAFVVTSLEVIPRYNQCFGLPLDREVLAWSLLACAAALVCIGLGAFSHPDRRLRALHAFFFVAFLAITWKSVFVRHFFHSLVLVPAFLATWEPLPGRRSSRLRSSAALVCVLAVCAAYDTGYRRNLFQQAGEFAARLGRHAAHAIAPGRHRATLEKSWWQTQLRSRLPDLKSRVGERTVDVFPPFWAAPIANGLTLRPRPLGVESCAEGLSRNGDHLAGRGAGEAPDFVLFWWAPFDDRHPGAVDSQALIALFTNYEAVLADRYAVLFERRTQAPVDLEFQEIASGRAELGSPVAIPGTEGWVLVSLDIDASFWGALRALFRAPAEQSIEVTTASGRVQTRRLPPGLASKPFLLSPFFTDTPLPSLRPVDLVGEPVRSFTIDAGPGAAGALQPAFAYTLYRLPAPWEGDPLAERAAE